MSNITIHAIDGGIFGHALCEEPTGDSTTYETDVTCGDCLDIVETADYDQIQRMRRQGWTPASANLWADR